MSSKLDKPLDDIVSAKRLSARNRRSTQRRSTDTRPSAPAGGIQKNSKPARGAAGKPALAKAITTGESKVIVSNLVSVSISSLPFHAHDLTTRHSLRMFRSSRSRYVSVEGLVPSGICWMFPSSPHPSFIL